MELEVKAEPSEEPSQEPGHRLGIEKPVIEQAGRSPPDLAPTCTPHPWSCAQLPPHPGLAHTCTPQPVVLPLSMHVAPTACPSWRLVLMMLMQVLAAASLEYSRGACIGVHTRVRNAPLPRALPASGCTLGLGMPPSPGHCLHRVDLALCC